MRLVTGYPGTTDAVLAMERGEIDGLCGLSWSTLTSRHAREMKEKKINLLVQAALKKQPELPDVPLVTELTQEREKLQILKLFIATQEMARPFAAPPDMPPERKAALIAAFDATMKDPEFLAEAAKLSMDVNPLGARGIDEIMADLYATPKPVLDKAAQAITK
jgi:tripartite-type tricarboxylate transporter receptor subunit TctC